MNSSPLTDESGEVRESTADDFKAMRPIAEVDPGMAEAMKAASQGRSMAEEVRRLLADGLAAEPIASEQTLGAAMRALFEPLGGLELPEIPR